jgi:hypothetical protein
MTTAAVVNICPDQRLDHGAIRLQVLSRLERMGIRADSVYLTNGAGGNIEADFRATVDGLVSQGVQIVFAAVLHHDGCDQLSQRRPLLTSTNELAVYLAQHNVRCPVLSGSIRTESNGVIWPDEAPGRPLPAAPQTRDQGGNEEPSLIGPIVALLVGVAAIIAISAVVMVLAVNEEDKEPETVQASPSPTSVLTPAFTPVLPSLPSAVSRTPNGHVLLIDTRDDCLAQGLTPVSCSEAIDLSGVEVWMENTSLFLLVIANEGGFQRLDTFTLRFAFDVDRNPASRGNSRYEANGLGHDLEIRFVKGAAGLAPQADISAGVAPPGPRRRTFDEHTVLIELAPFPVKEFDMLVRLDVGETQDIMPDGGKLSMPEGRLVPK